MKNTTGTPKDRWKKVKNVIIDPVVVLPILLGFGFLVLTYLIDDNTLKELLFFKPFFLFVSAFGIGIGVNHFITLFKDQTEYRKLENKAEFTVRLIDIEIKKILRKDSLTLEDKNLIDNLLNLMDYWKDYYDKVDASKIGYLRRLKKELEQITNKDEKLKKEIELDNLEYELLENGLTSYIELSGSTAYNFFKNKINEK